VAEAIEEGLAGTLTLPADLGGGAMHKARVGRSCAPRKQPTFSREWLQFLRKFQEYPIEE